MKINRIERHNITRGHPMWKWCDEYCLKSKNMYNYANWFVKQEFYKTGKLYRN